MERPDVNLRHVDLGKLNVVQTHYDKLAVEEMEEMDEFGLTKPPEVTGGDRGKWTGKLDFLMAALSYAVGLGSLWRFPYLVYRNGGGAFLIPYIIMNFLSGVPLFLLEMSMGQFSSSGVINIWRLCPLFKGMGYAMVTVSGVIAPYYNMIIAWSLVFLFESFTDTLPWSHCDNEWNTDSCNLKHKPILKELKYNCTQMYTNATFKNGVCTYMDPSTHEAQSLVMHNVSLTLAADEYFHGGVLNITSGLTDFGQMQWQLVLALFGAWVLTFLVIIKGPQSSGKVAYFTAIFPYFVMMILLVRGLTLEGHMKGIEFYITPNWTKLGEPSVWGDAAVQVTFSLACGWGGVLTLASYKQFHSNVVRETYLICGVTACTAIFSGFVIFSVIGFMAEELGVEVPDVVAQGAGLAFIAYPEAIAMMPVSPLWSILFFSMILTLGVGTQIAIVTTVVSTIIDSSPKLLARRLETTIAFCVIAFLIGLPLCSGAGMYILQLLDNYIATWAIIIICILESLIFTFIYGLDRLLTDIECMTGSRPSKHWKVLWAVVCPTAMFFILISTFVDYAQGKGSSYGRFKYPVWADALGLFVSFISVAMIPLYITYQVMIGRGPLLARVRELLVPTDDWGPADPINRKARIPHSSTTASTVPMLQDAALHKDFDEHSEATGGKDNSV